MCDLNIQEVAINLKLLKRYRFYQSFDPNVQKYFGVNVYRLSCIIFTAIAQLVVVYASFGFSVEMEDTLTEVEYVLVIAIHLQYYICLAKVSLLFYNSEEIWDVFDVVRMNFLTSGPCSEHINILQVNRDRSIKFSNLYVILPVAVTIQWLVFPLTYMYMSDNSEATNHRQQNIFNFRFPVTLHTYNQYFAIFYLMEMIIAIFFCYFLSMIDVLFMSLCWAIDGQYEVLTLALELFGHENDRQIEGDYERFESILLDQQQVYLKVKSFNSVVKSLILIFVTINSGMIILMSYAFIVICTSAEAFSILSFFKISTSIFYVSFKLFLYCNFFDEMNLKKEFVDFGLYCCNWTKMDLRFKKLLLLAMRVNGVNQLILKASPTRMINLQLFANVMTRSYNIVSVMLKSTREQTVSEYF